MTIGARAISIATKNGIRNADILAKAADEVGIGFAAACTLMQMESDGMNIWGNDKGGTFAGKKTEVNHADYLAFRRLVVEQGHTSNGVGPSQITWRGFFTDMEHKGLKPWDLHDNMKYGLTLLLGYYKETGSWVKAGQKYNGALSYGLLFAARRVIWRSRLKKV